VTSIERVPFKYVSPKGKISLGVCTARIDFIRENLAIRREMSVKISIAVGIVSLIGGPVEYHIVDLAQPQKYHTNYTVCGEEYLCIGMADENNTNASLPLPPAK
jgi:hypothetical protein